MVIVYPVAKRANPALAALSGLAAFQRLLRGSVRSRNSTLAKYKTPSNEKWAPGEFKKDFCYKYKTEFFCFSKSGKICPG
jgi:hypothetical protein